MDELQFEYERDPLSKEQAVDSIKKTEWLEYLDYRKYSVIVTTWFGLFMLGMWVLEWLGDLSPVNHIGIVASAVGLPILFLGYLAVLAKLRRRYSLVVNRQYGIKQKTRPSRLIKFAPIGVVVILIIISMRSATITSLARYLLITCWIFSIAIEWGRLHKLKKNLHAWGVLESEANS